LGNAMALVAASRKYQMQRHPGDEVQSLQWCCLFTALFLGDVDMCEQVGASKAQNAAECVITGTWELSDHEDSGTNQNGDEKVFAQDLESSDLENGDQPDNHEGLTKLGFPPPRYSDNAVSIVVSEPTYVDGEMEDGEANRSIENSSVSESYEHVPLSVEPHELDENEVLSCSEEDS